MSPEAFTFPEHLEDYLSDHNVLNLSTHGSDGPWASAVFFAHQGLRFFFMSDPDTRHGRHILETGAAAGSVHEDYSVWQEIKGLQMSGRIRVVEDPDEQRAGLRAYFRKYSFAEAFFRGEVPAPVRERMKDVRLFCFEPDCVLWLDNSRSFGCRLQIYPAPDND